MTLEKRAVYWFGAILVFAWILYILSPVLAPFLFGAVLAYFLNPLVQWMQKHGFSRTAAAILVLLFGLGAIIVAGIFAVPSIYEELNRLMSEWPSNWQNIKWRVYDLLPGTSVEKAKQIKDAAGEVGTGALKGLWISGGYLVETLTVLFGAPIIALYLLIDWDRLIERVDELLPREQAPTIRLLAGRIDEVLGSFLRGQLSVCLILGTFYAVSLGLIGLNYGVLIGILAGLICFIPFVGSAVGFVMATSIAFVQFGTDWPQIALVGGIFIFGQVIEGNLLTPYLVGGSVGLHPVWLIFALSAFGYLLGFTGLVLAVPMAAALGVVARWGIERYQESALYRSR